MGFATGSSGVAVGVRQEAAAAALRRAAHVPANIQVPLAQQEVKFRLKTN